MPLILAGVGIAAPVVAGIAGDVLSSGDREKQRQLQEQALAGIQGVSTPDIEAMKVALEKYKSTGQMSPELEAYINLGPSALQEVQTDPRLLQAQMNALEQLKSIGATGFRPEDEAMLAKIKTQVAQQEQGRQQAILQNMQERGIAGSGAELAAKLQSSQSAANRASGQDLQIAGDASQRALQAIMNSGNLASSLRSQGFGEEAKKAEAADTIAKYNAMNQQATQQRNVGSKNEAQKSNLVNMQDLANRNTDLTNSERLRNAQLQQQDYENKLRKAQSAGSAMTGLGNYYGSEAERTANRAAQIGAGVSQGAVAGAGFAQQSQNADLKKKLAGV